MIIKTAEFVGSFPSVDKCPESDLPEYAFIGRSNVGKSSLINMLTGRKSLAKVSNTPGKTQAINYFRINDTWHLVDLPGYGYAQRSKTERKRWEQMIRAYFLRRPQLIYVFQLIDSRIPPQKIDMEHLRWLGEYEVPFIILYTKNDKPKKTKANIKAIEKEILKDWKILPMNFVTCANDGLGRDAVLQTIDSWNRQVEDHL